MTHKHEDLKLTVKPILIKLKKIIHLLFVQKDI